MSSAQRVIDVARSEIFIAQPSLEILLNAGVRAVQSTPLNKQSQSSDGNDFNPFAEPHRPNERQLHLIDRLARQAADLPGVHASRAGLSRKRGTALSGLITSATGAARSAFEPRAEQMFGCTVAQARGSSLFKGHLAKVFTCVAVNCRNA